MSKGYPAVDVGKTVGRVLRANRKLEYGLEFLGLALRYGAKWMGNCPVVLSYEWIKTRASREVVCVRFNTCSQVSRMEYCDEASQHAIE